MTQRDLRFSSACDPAPWRHLGRLPLPDSGFLSVQQASASSEFSEAFRSLTLLALPLTALPLTSLGLHHIHLPGLEKSGSLQQGAPQERI